MRRHQEDDKWRRTHGEKLQRPLGDQGATGRYLAARRHPGDLQEAPRRHPRDTQETTSRHAGSIQEAPTQHPKAPRRPEGS